MRPNINALLAGLVLASALLAGCQERAKIPPPAKAAGQELVVRRLKFNPFPQATSVRLFMTTGRFEEHPTGKRMTFEPVAGHPLTVAQREELEGAVRPYVVVERPPVDPNAAIATGAACFVPHHFFRYFDAKGRKLGEVAVCFCCEGVEVLPSTGRRDGGYWGNDGGADVDYARLKALVRSLGYRTDIHCDEP